MTKYPVVKMKELRNYTIGDVVRLKKTGELVKIAKYASDTGSCKRCVFGDHCNNQSTYREASYISEEIRTNIYEVLFFQYLK